MNVIAVDVGTTSVRLAIVSFLGECQNEAEVIVSHDQEISHSQDGCKFQQKSKVIWQAICDCCRICLNQLPDYDLNQSSIRALAFSSTCSLVIQNDITNDDSDDIIMWMDHRAVDEAQEISDSGSKVLTQVGGVCSPEFSLSKLVWLKAKDPERFASAKGFFELPDWLVYRCTDFGPELSPRSLCSLVCKWGYDIHGAHCDELRSLFNGDELDMQSKLGSKVLCPGTVAGRLGTKAALELGFEPHIDPSDIVIGTSLIDAHSGMLAMLPLIASQFNSEIESSLCSLAGTSSCHMLLSKRHQFTRGIWGPYKDVILKDFYLSEAGQSLTGKLVEMCIRSHPEGKTRLEAGESFQHIVASINKDIPRQANSTMHVLPTFHGNRSPLANPRLKGGIYGLTAEIPGCSLSEYYIATIESMAYEMKFIFESLRTHIDNIIVSGGLTKNDFYMQSLADVLQAQVVSSTFGNVDAMVMGSALVARQAVLNSHLIDDDPLAHQDPLREDNIRHIEFKELKFTIFKPRDDRYSNHAKKYACYKEFVQLSQNIDKIMQSK